jgi:LCP family protein required for cell wall assembly
VDTRSRDPQEIIGRGDTQIIVSVDREAGTVKMTSILRDTVVPIPGYRKQTKINNAYQYGCNKVKKGTVKEKIRSGASLAMRTINRNFQMNIANYVAINFNGLASIIDALGGIDDQKRALTGGERAADLVIKIHMPRGVDQVEGIILSILRPILQPDRAGLNRDAAFFLELHIIENLIFHYTRLHGAALVDQAV